MCHLVFFAILGWARCDDVSYVEVPLNSKFTLGWEFQPSSIQFTFTVRDRQCKLNGWCGIGLNGGMTNTDMLVVSTIEGNVTVWDMYSTGDFAPSNDTQLGGVDNAVFLTGNYSQGVTTATFARALNTSDPYDTVLSIGLTTPFCFAYWDRDDTFHQHRFEASGIIAFGGNQSTSYFLPTKTYSDDYQTHGIMLGVAWMPVMLVSIAAARYFKFYWMWYWVHLAAGLFTLAVNYIYGMWAYTQDQPVYEWTTKQWLYHNRLGFTLMALLPLQIITGLLARLWTWKTKSVQALSVARRIHYVSGWALMATAQVNIYYGLQGYKPLEVHKLNWAFSTLAAIFLALETWHWVSSVRTASGLGALSLGKLRQMTHSEVFELVTNERKKLVFLDNLVLNVESFFDSHPGGANLIRDSLGEDHGKYVYGVSAASGQQAGFAHPMVVWKYVSRLSVGRVQFHSGIVVNRTAFAQLENMQWTLSSRTIIAANTVLFSFLSDSLYIKAQPDGVEWMGGHFRVTATIAGIVVHRYYSLCLFFNVENLQKWYNSAEKHGFHYNASQISGANTTLDLIIKEYPPHGRMSTFIHQFSPGSPLTITGPMGPGLILTPGLKGHYCAFGAGTGVLPFLDLVEFLWWKETYAQIGVDNNRYAALTDFSLTVYASFYRVDDIIGKDLLEATDRLCKSSSKPRFQLVLFLDEEKRANPKEVIEEILEKVEVKRAWICGPAGFCKWVKGIVKEAGVSRRKIVVM